MRAKKVAFQGERGSFSESASIKMLGGGIQALPCDSFDTLFDRVEARKADYGIVPIENSLVGSIHRNYDLLLERSLSVIGEIYFRVNHCLIAPPGTSLRKISKVYSHPVALEQCRRFFKENLSIAPISYYDTAGAVRMIAETQPTNAAAIAGEYAAKYYGMKIVKRSLEDESSNFTRFLLLNRKPVKTKGTAKTSIVFSIINQPGGLFKALSVFALREIDLTKIESRPVRHKAWEYYFYVDFIGQTDDPKVAKALSHLAEITHFIKVLGCYPAVMPPA